MNTVVSVITGKGIRSTVGVVTRKDDSDRITVNYPHRKGSNEVFCGSTGYSISLDHLKIRQATAEEIKEWRNAVGPAKTARTKANTPDKVKEIRWVAVDLGMGYQIVTSF